MERWLCWGATAAILLLAALLRLQDLGNPGLDNEELRAMHLARNPAAQFWSELRISSGATPLGYGVLRFASLYGLRERPLRLPSALCGVVAVAAAMLLLRDLFNERAALAAGLIFAASPLHVELSRRALGAGPAAAAALVLTWLLWRSVRGARVFMRCVAAGALGLYFGYTALMVLAAGLFTAGLGLARGWVTRTAALRTAAICVVALVLFAPWLVYDLPTEPGRQFVRPNVTWDLAPTLTEAPLLGVPTPATELSVVANGRIAGGVSLVVLALSFLGIAIAWRHSEASGTFVSALLLAALCGTLLTARFAPYFFSPSQLLFVYPVYLGLAAFGFDWIVRRSTPSWCWMAVTLTAAATLVWSVERPALSFQEFLAAQQDWRGAFDLVLQNLGRDDLVSAPGAGDAVEFYGSELRRRISKRDRPTMALAWTAKTDFSWLITGANLRLDPNWLDSLQRFQQQRFLVDLSPTVDPAVFFMGKERHPTYLLACHFELPAETIARGSFLRDCLREIGPAEGPLRQLHTLLADASVSLANPTLLESVALLKDAGKLDQARALADAIVLREPEWPEARATLERLGEVSATTLPSGDLKPTPQRSTPAS